MTTKQMHQSNFMNELTMTPSLSCIESTAGH